MSRSTHNDLLLKLGDADLNHRFAGADLRNRKVLGPDGKDIGHVSALFLDRAECQVRFLQVGTGGFLGLGEREFLIPVEDLTITEPAEVQIAHTREQVLAEPHFDPHSEAGQDQAFWATYYGYYGHTPYWITGE
jgi:PRC-barrel domain